MSDDKKKRIRPLELWREADGDQAKYQALMVEHGWMTEVPAMPLPHIEPTGRPVMPAPITDDDDLPPDFTDAEYEEFLRANPGFKKEIDESWERFIGSVVTCSIMYSPHIVDTPDGHKCKPPLMSARSYFDTKEK